MTYNDPVERLAAALFYQQFPDSLSTWEQNLEWRPRMCEMFRTRALELLAILNKEEALTP